MGNLKVAGLDIGSHNLTIDEPSGTLLVDGEEISGSGGGGISYVWANETARTATTGMKTDEQGLQQDTGIVYKYTGSAWVPYYSLLTLESYVAPSSGVKYVWIDEAAKLAQTGMSTDEQGVQEDTNTVYKYDGTVWEEHYVMSDSTVQKYYEGTSAPINSKLGDEWFDYNDGTLYKKVSDGTDSVWMAVNSSIGGGDIVQYDIGSNEFVLPYTRNGKRVYGREFDCGALPNTVTKDVVIPNYNASYTYWVCSSDSYSVRSSDNTRIPLPYVASNVAPDTNVNVFTAGNSIKIATYTNRSTFDITKVVLHYTKD